MHRRFLNKNKATVLNANNRPVLIIGPAIRCYSGTGPAQIPHRGIRCYQAYILNRWNSFVPLKRRLTAFSSMTKKYYIRTGNK